MSECVVDASIFGPLFFTDETDTLFGELEALLARGGCIAPQHWRLELANQILIGFRRKRMTEAMVSPAIATLTSFDVTIDYQTWQRHEEIFDLARAQDLTIYDAAYLELALLRKASLASYDNALCNAAQRMGVEVFSA
ncbi:type II toxin-antitoxin system VapC family toxin [Novosphingobium sp. B 225]|uniref:type II toxin-antitoxin system VapC family toxin n=1 Tax=Novosphingobium sp. B 225 TaxID=1961849 RepID=UPI000B4BD6EF|nr:type II toxin-antitoxin system VapC family toxin [Novosphingobium sp. B 225]